MEEHETGSIEDRLRQAWRQERRFCHLRGASRLSIWICSLIVVDFLIDWGIFFRTGLTANVGFLLVMVNVGVLLWVLWREWLRHLRPYNPLLVALDVESESPELSSLLVSYTQIEDTLAKQPHVSADLVEAVRAEAVTRTKKLDFRDIVDFGQLTRLFGVAAVVVVFFGVLSVSWQDHLKVLFQRLAGAEVGYPTDTQVGTVTGDVTVRVGDSTTIDASAAGVIPEAGEIYTRAADSDDDWKVLPMKRHRVQPSFARELEELTTDVEYYVHLGDDRSKRYRIHVVAAPIIVEAEVQLTYPAYMGLGSTKTDQLNIEVAQGSTLAFRLRCEPAVKRLVVKTDSETFGSFDASVDESGKVLTFSLKADEAFKYTFHWTERGSGNDFEFDDVQHSVRVTADKIPEVELIRPGASGLATVNKELKINARASDDRGLSQAWLVYLLDGSEELRKRIYDFAGKDREAFAYTWVLKDDIPDLKPGVRISFAIEVADRHPDAQKRLRRSATRHLTIVDPERYLAWYREELSAQTDEIKRARDAEKTSASRVKQLKDQEVGNP
jgi:hypothetical protein